MIRFNWIKSIGLSVFISLFGSKNASAQTYTFSHFSQPYTLIQGGIPFDVDSFMTLTDVPIGFEFPIMDFSIDSIELNLLGIHQRVVVNGELTGLKIYPFGAGYADMENLGQPTNSEGVYLTTGLPGSRVFTVQWTNMKFSNDSIGDQFIHFQARFFEADGSIEFHIGPSHITQENIYFTDAPGGFVGLIKYNPLTEATLFESICLIQNADNPTMIEYADWTAPYTLTGTPESGMVYRFSRNDVGFNEKNAQTAVLAPNPASDITELRLNEMYEGEITLSDYTGRIVLRQNMSGQNLHLNLTGLKSGVYTVRTGTTNKAIRLSIH